VLSLHFKCVCGAEHQWPSETAMVIRHQTLTRGERMQVTTPAGSWMVPRVYIAAHGLKAADLPTLAALYGFEPAA
jgi:hypothetical protein